MSNIKEIIKLLITLNIQKPEKRIIVGLLMFVALICALPFLKVGGCTEKLFIIPFIIAIYLSLSYLAYTIKNASRNQFVSKVIDWTGVVSYIVIILFSVWSYAYDCVPIQALVPTKDKEYTIIKIKEKCIPAIKKGAKREVIIKEFEKNTNFNIELNIIYYPITINSSQKNFDCFFVNYVLNYTYPYEGFFGFLREGTFRFFHITQNILLPSYYQDYHSYLLDKYDILNLSCKYMIICGLRSDCNTFEGYINDFKDIVSENEYRLQEKNNLQTTKKSIETPVIKKDTVWMPNDKESFQDEKYISLLRYKIFHLSRVLDSCQSQNSILYQELNRKKNN